MANVPLSTPVQDGIAKTAHAVCYREATPPRDLTNLVHCFWELKTVAPLAEDFQLHAVPDACVNILFNEMDTRIAGITALRTTYEVLNLGKVFHDVGIQRLPGVWQGKGDEIAYHYVGTPYAGALPLIETNQQLAGLDFLAKQPVMAQLVRHLATETIVVANRVTLAILTYLDDRLKKMMTTTVRLYGGAAVYLACSGASFNSYPNTAQRASIRHNKSTNSSTLIPACRIMERSVPGLRCLRCMGTTAMP